MLFLSAYKSDSYCATNLQGHLLIVLYFELVINYLLPVAHRAIFRDELNLVANRIHRRSGKF